MLQHETKVNPQQLWENEWEDEELSDAQLENICGGTGDYGQPHIPISTPGSDNNTTNPALGPGIGNPTGFATVTDVYYSDPGVVQQVMALDLNNLTVTITGLGLQTNP